MFWTLQINSLLPILANCVSFLVLRRSCIRRLKLGSLAITGMIAMSGLATWLPAVMQLTPAFVEFSWEWDRTTKAVFALTDLGLDVLFLQSVWQNPPLGGPGQVLGAVPLQLLPPHPLRLA